MGRVRGHGGSFRLPNHTRKRHISLRGSTFACEIFHKRVSYRPLMPTEEQNRSARGLGEGYSYVGAGFAFAFAILLFGALGWLIDGWLHTRPIIAIIGAFVGGFAGFMSIYYRVKKDTEKR